jgi:prevent-host-death family protein
MFVLAWRRLMTTLAVTEARKKLYRLLDSVRQSHEPVHISGKRGGAVLVSEDDWRAIQETLYLLSIPGMRESIIKGLKTPVRRCLKDIQW